MNNEVYQHTMQHLFETDTNAPVCNRTDHKAAGCTVVHLYIEYGQHDDADIQYVVYPAYIERISHYAGRLIKHWCWRS